MLLTFLFYATLIGLAIYVLQRMLNPPMTFDRYKAKFPHLVKDGRVHCSSCSGTSIWMKHVSGSPFGSTYMHSCRSCGADLYQSKGK